MIRLVSYNAHGNRISVFNDTKNSIFYKVAADSSAVFGLKKRKVGWDWYFNHVLRSKASVKIFQKEEFHMHVLKLLDLRARKLGIPSCQKIP